MDILRAILFFDFEKFSFTSKYVNRDQKFGCIYSFVNVDRWI